MSNTVTVTGFELFHLFDSVKIWVGNEDHRVALPGWQCRRCGWIWGRMFETEATISIPPSHFCQTAKERRDILNKLADRFEQEQDSNTWDQPGANKP